MHLVQREHLPEPTNGDQKRKHKHDNNQEETSAQPLSSNSTSGCCDACSILCIFCQIRICALSTYLYYLFYIILTKFNRPLSCSFLAGGFHSSYTELISSLVLLLLINIYLMFCTSSMLFIIVVIHQTYALIYSFIHTYTHWFLF